MEEKRNLKTEPLEKLQKELELTQHKIEVEERRLNLARQQIKVAKRKARNHRLIVKGAEWEKAFPETEALTDEEFRRLLQNLSYSGHVRDIVQWSVRHSGPHSQPPSPGEEG